MKYLVLLSLFLCFSCQSPKPTDSSVPSSKKLKISPNGRYLMYVDGRPFFYLGDTAWELFHRTNREEADLYLNNRAEKGFTVIQAVVLAELEGLTVPNSLGDLPLLDQDPSQPNEAYFQHVDYIVDKAAELGMFIGMLPTWGDKFNLKWGQGPEVFTPENALSFGKYLGNRYKDKPIIWILGGDRNPEEADDLEIIRAMARGLKAGDGGKHLMTYHPQGDFNSAAWFHLDEWLDFNMFQSGHGSFNKPNFEMNLENRKLRPVKPTLDGEPRYEDHPVNWKPENGWFMEFDVRQAAYWNVFSGSCGHTYGNHNIWQMWQEGREPISSARTPWKVALDHPGSFQMGHLRSLMESLDWHQLQPDTTVLSSTYSDGASRIFSLRSEDGKQALIYTPYGLSMSLNPELFPVNQIQTQWFDPKTGNLQAAEASDEGKFTPPGQAKGGNDWVLRIDLLK